MNERVVVTGMGIITPLHPFEEMDVFWNALCSGEDAIRQMKPPLLDLGREWPMAAIRTSAFPEDTQAEDRAVFLARKALETAVADSGLDISSIVSSRTGLVTGTVLGNILYKELYMMNASHARPAAIYNEGLSDIASGLAHAYNLNGPVMTVSTACASGTDAVGIAARRIMSGSADIMFAGGVDVLSDFAIAGFNSLQAITRDRVRPFDKNRTGLALGEGAAFLVLEKEQQARGRGTGIYAGISGYASRADANHLTGPHRDGRGLAEAIRSVLSESGTTPDEIDYVNAHGTGTVYNDLMETKALKAAFGESAYRTSISSTKSMLGHSFGAAGVIEAICCILAIKKGLIPPTINFTEKDDECDLDYTPNTAKEKQVGTAMSLSAGFGGQNSVITFTAQ